MRCHILLPGRTAAMVKRYGAQSLEQFRHEVSKQLVHSEGLQLVGKRGHKKPPPNPNSRFAGICFSKDRAGPEYKRPSSEQG